MDNPLAKLSLDYWYKVLIVAGAFVFLLNGGGLLPAYPTGATAMLSAGVFLWGIGEWINHPYQEVLTLDPYGRPTGKISGYRRNPKIIGIAFDIAGFLLIGFGAIKLF